MASKALVAMTPPLEYMNILIKLTAQLPGPLDHCCHNRLHGQLLQIKAVLHRALCTQRWHSKTYLYWFIRHFQTLKSCCVSICSAPSADLCKVLSKMDASLWLATEVQRCPLVRSAYLAVADSLRGLGSETYQSKLYDTLTCQLHTPQQGLQVRVFGRGWVTVWEMTCNIAFSLELNQNVARVLKPWRCFFFFFN